MIKRVMLWAALVSMTSAMAAEPLQRSLGPARTFPTQSMPSKAQSAAFAKAVLANVPESQRLRSADSTAAGFDQFGYSVAVDSNTAVIGIWGNDEGAADAGEGDGAVEVWLRSGNTWALQQRIIPADLALGDNFGWSVAISGDTMAVGSPFADAGGVDSGAVYVYVRSAGVWSLQQKLAGTLVDGGDRFGYSVDIDGNTVIAGAKTDEVGAVVAGAAYVFTRSGSIWSQQGRLTVSGPLGQEADAFGSAVRVSGDYAVIGAEYANTVAGEDAGAAYVFKRAASVWSQQVSLFSNAPSAGAQFGHAVAIDGGTIVVSDHNRSSSTGRAVVYTGADATWTVQQTLSASDGQPSDFFGHALSIVGDALLVGAYQADLGSNIDRGSAYRFTRSGSVWTQIDKYLASDASTTSESEHFGFDVCLTPGAAVVGAPQDEVVVAGPSTLQDAGAVYVYHLGTPTTTIQILNPVPATFGGILGLSAQVTGGTPTGNVEFRNGLTVLASVALNGSGVAATTITPNAGAYSVTAFYLGDGTHLSSNSSATAFTVAKATTSLSLGSNNSPSTYGQNVTFTATVSTTAPGASPVTGSVEFRDNGVLLATVPLSSGTASHTTNALPHNTGIAHPITASFIANTNYTASTGSTINHVVNKAVPTLTLVSNPNPSLFGQSVAITGTLSGGLAPTGTVTFFDGITLMGSNNLVAGVATRNTSALALGAHSLQATYAGDDNHDSANTSAPTVHNVLPSADVSVTKTNGTSFVQSGQDTTYTIVVNNPAGGADTDGLLVNDTLNPAQFDVPNADWSCAPAGICTPESGTGNLANLPLDLPAGSSVTITVTVPVLPEAESGVSNTVSLTMPVDVGDPNPSNNTATDSDGSGLFNDGFESGPAS
ncbi:MAG: Ig-like domain repeat protein [Xanthomonadales bacterium]|nr:Ig-like domain repeat protein [Xanthomonadales bacterium]